MDPKMPSNLDPKLKEAYERVMGTPSGTPAAAAPPQPAVVQRPFEPIEPNTAPPPPPVTSPQMSASPVSAVPEPKIKENVASTAFVAKPQKENKSGISPVIIFLGLLVFIAVYSLFWIKFFNLPIPFLPQ